MLALGEPLEVMRVELQVLGDERLVVAQQLLDAGDHEFFSSG